MNEPTLYIFLDEGGNFDFSPNGTRYFSLSCVSMVRPFRLHTKLDTYKYDLIEYRIKPRIDLEHFNCAEDNAHVRQKVFGMIAEGTDKNCVDAVLVEKSKTGPSLQEPSKFYPKMLGYLLRHTINHATQDVGEVVVITDTIPVARKRRAIEKAVKTTLKEMLDTCTPYRVMHHASKAHYGLQIADYFNWAIYRRWEHGDPQAYNLVKDKIRSEFDIFRTGTHHYY